MCRLGGGGGNREENRQYCGGIVFLFYLVIINEYLLCIRYFVGFGDIVGKKQIKILVFIGLIFQWERYKIIKENKKQILDSDKCWRGLEIMQEKNGGGIDEIRWVKFRYVIIDGQKGFYYIIFEQVQNFYNKNVVKNGGKLDRKCWVGIGLQFQIRGMFY